MPQQPPDADVIIAGAGLSGLLVARALLCERADGAPPRVLLADPRPPAAEPATYAFWTRGPTALDRWTIGRWRQIAVVDSSGRRRVAPLREWHYLAIDWRAARSELLAAIRADPRATVLASPVEQVLARKSGAAVLVGGRWLSARRVFDSRPPAVSGPRSGRRALSQSFRGVWVRAAASCLATDTAVLMDFTAADGGDASDDLGFSYVLPTAADRALVMAVRMGADHAAPDPLPAVRRLLGDVPWTPDGWETGTTPLALFPRRQRPSGSVVPLGVRGGRARPSTGYAVARSLADARSVARSRRSHRPLALPRDPRFERALDRIWLNALRRERAGLEPAFVQLFADADPDVVLRFLDGRPSPAEVLEVVRALPPRPFLRALLG